MRPSPIAPRGGFTRRKLAVPLAIATVFVILLILVSLIPGHDTGDHRKLEARQTCAQICAAINAYYTEYGEFPPLSPLSVGHSQNKSDKVDAIVGDPAMTLSGCEVSGVPLSLPDR